MPLEPERRQALLAVKLRALVRDQWGEGDRQPSPFPGGAALRSSDGRTGWVLVEHQPVRALGGALAWSRRGGGEEVGGLGGAAGGGLGRRGGPVAPAPHG